MPNYASSKIYQIISPNYPLPYIGSTTQPLCKRMAVHRCQMKCRSRVLIEAGDAYIELIEDYPCANREQLNRREGELIRSRECVNRQVAGRTDAEYYEDNREYIRNQVNNRRKMNPEVLRARDKAYYQAHREVRLRQQKAYQQRKKAKALAI